MKRLSRLGASVTLLLTLTMLVKADPIDPVFTMSDPDTGTPIFSTSFSFSSNGNGGGLLSFVNQSQTDWKSLAVQVIQPTGTIVSCSGGPFFPTCLISTIPQSNNLSLFTLNLTLRTKDGGLPNGEFFTLNLNDLLEGVQPIDPNGSGGWGANAPFSAQVTDYVVSNTPEPATFFLLAFALTLLFPLRRLIQQGR